MTRIRSGRIDPDGRFAPEASWEGRGSVGRRDFYDNPEAPAANSLVPAASAIVVDDARILLHRRQDNDRWALPGGKMELGESLAGCAIREVKEETGLEWRSRESAAPTPISFCST